MTFYSFPPSYYVLFFQTLEKKCAIEIITFNYIYFNFSVSFPLIEEYLFFKKNLPGFLYLGHLQLIAIDLVIILDNKSFYFSIRESLIPCHYFTFCLPPLFHTSWFASWLPWSAVNVHSFVTWILFAILTAWKRKLSPPSCLVSYVLSYWVLPLILLVLLNHRTENPMHTKHPGGRLEARTFYTTSGYFITFPSLIWQRLFWPVLFLSSPFLWFWVSFWFPLTACSFLGNVL